MQATLTFSNTRTTSFRALERCSIEELLIRSQNGDLDARHALVGRYQNIIHSTARRMTSTRQDADDLAIDAYLHIFSVINSCNNIQTLPGWIKRVAINLVYQSWRKKGRQPLPVSLEAMVESVGDDVLSTGESANPATLLLEQTIQEERSERLRAALTSLPAHQRILCELHYSKKKSIEEISQETGLPLGTIKSRLFRARETMQRKLGDFFVA